MSATTWAELHLDGDERPVLVNPAAVLLVWEVGDGSTRVVLTNGDRIDVREPYRRVSALLHEAAQAGVAA